MHVQAVPPVLLEGSMWAGPKPGLTVDRNAFEASFCLSISSMDGGET